MSTTSTAGAAPPALVYPGFAELCARCLIAILGMLFGAVIAFIVALSAGWIPINC